MANRRKFGKLTPSITLAYMGTVAKLFGVAQSGPYKT